MRTVGISMMFALLVSGAAACGGDDGGDDGNTDNQNDDDDDDNADDDIVVDDNVDDNTDDTDESTDDVPPPDGSSGSVMGLGQKCDPAMMNADCPTNAPFCVGIAGGNGNTYCTPTCLENGSSTTNAQGQFTAFTPAPSQTACPGAFTSTPGNPVCGLILAYTPMDANPAPNTAYTGIALGCAVLCDAGACPTGMTCSTIGQNQICEPM
jgi:hypothetical protein